MKKKTTKKEVPSFVLNGIKSLKLERIKKDNIRKFTETALLLAPEDFWVIPASSSGKYHPQYSQGEGGLLRHTMATTIIAEELFPLHNFIQREKDYILAALMLHDICKPSKTHPVEVKLHLESLRSMYPREFEWVISLVESHTGQWNLDGRLPKPRTSLQKYVHLCDYLSSRKCLEMIFPE